MRVTTALESCTAADGVYTDSFSCTRQCRRYRGPRRLCDALSGVLRLLSNACPTTASASAQGYGHLRPLLGLVNRRWWDLKALADAMGGADPVLAKSEARAGPASPQVPG